MDSPLMNRWRDLKLTDEEERIADCSGIGDENFIQNAAVALAGKILTNKPYRVTGLFGFLRHSWRTRKPFEIKELGSNLYIFHFGSPEDKNRIKEGGPWVFDKQLLLLTDIKEGASINELKFEEAAFWIRGEVPFGKVTRGTAMVLAQSFGGLIDYRMDDDKGWCKYVVFKAMVKIDRPLVRGVVTNFGECGTRWVPFTYEKLPNFCYGCGRLGCVAFDPGGCFLWASCRSLPFINDINQLELLAMELACKEAERMELFDFAIASDSSFAVDCLNGLGQAGALCFLVEDICERLANSGCGSVVWVKRDMNVAAHSLAAWSSEHEGCHFFSRVPSWLREVLR